MKDKLRRLGLGARFAGRLGFPTLGTLVSSYVSANEVDWSDWTDRPRDAVPHVTART